MCGLCSLQLNLCWAQRIDRAREKKEEWWEKYKDKRGERERIPCCFSNQEASSSSLGDLFSLLSFMSQFPTPPTFSSDHQHPILHFFSFILSPDVLSFCGQLVNITIWNWRQRHIQAGGVVIMTHLYSCEVFMWRKILTAHFSLWINAAASDEAERGRDTEHLLFIKAALSDVWPLWPTLISVWQRSLHTSKDQSPLRMNNESGSRVKTKYILSS